MLVRRKLCKAMRKNTKYDKQRPLAVHLHCANCPTDVDLLIWPNVWRSTQHGLVLVNDIRLASKQNCECDILTSWTPSVARSRWIAVAINVVSCSGFGSQLADCLLGQLRNSIAHHDSDNMVQQAKDRLDDSALYNYAWHRWLTSIAKAAWRNTDVAMMVKQWWFNSRQPGKLAEIMDLLLEIQEHGDSNMFPLCLSPVPAELYDVSPNKKEADTMPKLLFG